MSVKIKTFYETTKQKMKIISEDPTESGSGLWKSSRNPICELIGGNLRAADPAAHIFSLAAKKNPRRTTSGE